MDYTTLIVLALVAAYMLYVAWRFRIGLGRAWQRSSKPWRDGRSLACVLTNDRGNCDYDLLWATQMPALEALKSAGAAEFRSREWQYVIENLLGRIQNFATVRLFRIGSMRCKTRT